MFYFHAIFHLFFFSFFHLFFLTKQWFLKYGLGIPGVPVILFLGGGYYKILRWYLPLSFTFSHRSTADSVSLSFTEVIGFSDETDSDNNFRDFFFFLTLCVSTWKTCITQWTGTSQMISAGCYSWSLKIYGAKYSKGFSGNRVPSYWNSFTFHTVTNHLKIYTYIYF